MFDTNEVHMSMMMSNNTSFWCIFVVFSLVKLVKWFLDFFVKKGMKSRKMFQNWNVMKLSCFCPKRFHEKTRLQNSRWPLEKRITKKISAMSKSFELLNVDDMWIYIRAAFTYISNSQLKQTESWWWLLRLSLKIHFFLFEILFLKIEHMWIFTPKISMKNDE